MGYIHPSKKLKKKHMLQYYLLKLVVRLNSFLSKNKIISVTVLSDVSRETDKLFLRKSLLLILFISSEKTWIQVNS